MTTECFRHLCFTRRFCECITCSSETREKNHNAVERNDDAEQMDAICEAEETMAIADTIDSHHYKEIDSVYNKTKAFCLSKQ